MIWSRWLRLTKKWMLSYKKERIPTVVATPPSPPWLPCLVEISFPQCYLSRFTLVPECSWPNLFWTPKTLFFLVLFVGFLAFLDFIWGESCIFQVFPQGGEKYIIDEFCRRYSLFWFDVSNHSKVPSPRFYNFVHPIIFWLMGTVTKSDWIISQHSARSHMLRWFKFCLTNLFLFIHWKLW